jgi:peptidoglycan biosynthesis protein MviN/MurJ (putative lipid II flippase)
MTQSLIAIRKTLPAIFLCVSRALLTYLLGYFLSSLWDYQGLALSFSIALVVNLFFLFPLFFRLSPFDRGWKDLFSYTAKLGLASSPALLFGWFIDRGSDADWLGFSKTVLMAGTGAGFLVGISTYFLFLFLLKVKEVRLVIQELKQQWSRKGWWLAEQVE